MTGFWVALGALLAGVVIGLLLRRHSGVISHRPRTQHAVPDQVAAVLSQGAAITLVQLSTTFCQPCRVAHRKLIPLAEHTNGLHYVDLDVTHEPQVASQLGVRRTPTTIAFTSDGGEVLRVSGIPDTEALLAELKTHL